MLRIIHITFVLVFLSSSIYSQSSTFTQPDNEKKVKAQKDSSRVRSHSPAKAMIFSAIIPGLGQAYNKKYWKIPIVYATMGTTIYFFNSNNTLYRQYKQAYINKTDTEASTTDLYPDYSDAQLRELEDYYRKYRDLNVILTALFYTLNVVDAYVDGHLVNFDVSDDLSFHLAPALNFQAASQKPSAGMTLTFKF